MAINFKFESAPKSTRTNKVNPEELAVAEMLRENPGREARVLEFEKPHTARQIVNQIHHGQRAAFRDGFRAKSRVVNGMGVVFITYVGTSDNAS